MMMMMIVGGVVVVVFVAFVMSFLFKTFAMCVKNNNCAWLERDHAG